MVTSFSLYIINHRMKFLTWIFINFSCVTLLKTDDFNGNADIYHDDFDNDSDEADSFPEVEKILRSLDQVSLPLNNENVVIIFGTRNSRKHYLIQLLTDSTDSLLYNTQENNWIIPNTNLKFLQDSSLLNLLSVNACSSNTLYLDFPTFNNNGNLLNDIQSKYYIWKILSHAKSVKFLLTIDYYMEDESINISEFVELINHINSFIINTDKYSNSFSLIVTATTKIQSRNYNIDNLNEKKNIIELKFFLYQLKMK
ncbi:uncharacterized protein LOC122499827 [Leptopilina heterotoma]|uniref:uncharacterized protein LOC122499827 n=1 Tax=Leptopilina heterotoma TaxID=63436 RepID=UPI001CA93021|nr:uncharacterized protein LOC122499827 [Leptopilina heterotoma]